MEQGLQRTSHIGVVKCCYCNPQLDLAAIINAYCNNNCAFIGKLEHEGVRYYKLQDIQCSNPKGFIFVFEERGKMCLFDE